MVADEQKHTLPETENGSCRHRLHDGVFALRRLCRSAAEAARRGAEPLCEAFRKRAATHLVGRQLVFTGDDDDPGNDRDAREYGFRQSPRRSSDHSRLALRPLCRDPLDHRARTADGAGRPSCSKPSPRRRTPTAAFLALRQAHRKTAAGVQLFSLLVSQPRLLKLLAAITARRPSSPKRSPGARALPTRFMEPAFFETVPTHANRRRAPRLAIRRGALL